MSALTRARRGLPWLAPGLLVAVALHQIVLAHGQGLSPWKGGGFGMFSSNDHGEARWVRVWAIDAKGERRLALPGAVTNLRYRARELPAEPQLRRLARALVELAPPDLGRPEAVRVEVWRTRHDPETLEPRLEPLRRLSVPIGELRR